jgi:hypothetical protein
MSVTKKKNLVISTEGEERKREKSERKERKGTHGDGRMRENKKE